MKKIFLMAGVCLLAASCSKECVEQVETETVMAPVKVHVSDFSMSVGEFPDAAGRTRDAAARTRGAVNPATYDGVGAITLAFYKEGTEVYKTTQVKRSASTYDTFGEFGLMLPTGSYTMVVVGYGLFDGDTFTLTSPESANFSPKARETFVKTQPVTITSAAAVDISATLNRIASRVTVESTDGRSAEAAKVRMTLSGGGISFSPTTGLATDNTGLVNTLNISKKTGETTSSTSFLFLTTDEQTIDVTIEVLDAAENTLYSKTVKDVPLKRNRITTLSGPLYTNASLTGAFLVNADWLDGETVNF